jgi:hypothetical protein
VVVDLNGMSRIECLAVAALELIPVGVGDSDESAHPSRSAGEGRARLCWLRRFEVKRQPHRQDMPINTTRGLRRMQLRSDQGGKVVSTVRPGISNREVVLVAEMICHAAKVVSRPCIQFTNLFDSIPTVTQTRVTVEIATVKVPRRIKCRDHERRAWRPVFTE